MPLSGLSATEHAPEARYRERHARDRPQKPVFPASAAPAANDHGEVFDADYYGRRFKTDLSQLRVFADAEEPPPAPDPEGDSALIDFFGHLSLLLIAVRAGDLVRAQAAADALQLDALLGVSDGSAALGDLVARLAAPEDMAAAAAIPPASNPYLEIAEDGGAAYETLAQYLDGEAGAA